MTKTSQNKEHLFEQAYSKITGKANSNAFLQGISGIAGFPATLAIDGVVIFTHYEPLINEIRELYGRNKIEKNAVMPVLGSIFKEVLLDITLDKLLGQIPIAGIYFNAICAKALTWRLGMLFTIVSSRGEEINYKNLSKVIKLVRLITPQSDMFQFAKPSYEQFKKITLSVEDNDFEIYDDKIDNALKAFD